MCSIMSDKEDDFNSSVMNMILRNIQHWNYEFSVYQSEEDTLQDLQLHNSKLRSQIIKIHPDDDKIIKALRNQNDTSSAPNVLHRAMVSLPSSCNEQYHDEESENETKSMNPENVLTKSDEDHVISQTVHSLPQHKDTITPPSLNALRHPSPTPLSSDESIHTESDSFYQEEDNDFLDEDSVTEEEEWQVVTNKSVRADPKLQPVFCYQRAICSKGSKCKNKHTPKEREVFEARKAAKAANDKDFNDTKFRTELCKVNVLHNLKKCRFAHGSEQLICRGCYEVGHKKDKCRKAENSTSSPTRS